MLDRKPSKSSNRKQAKTSLILAAATSYPTHVQRQKETKAKLNYWDLIKIKTSCITKETISKTKRKPMEWEKIFANYISDEDRKSVV